MFFDQGLLRQLSAITITGQTTQQPAQLVNNMAVPDFDLKNPCIIPEYDDGNPNELYSFISACTLILNKFWNNTDPGSFQNHILLRGLSSKLRGRAKEIASVYGCGNWKQLKAVLIQNFDDQRNENSLTRDLVNLRQGPTKQPQQLTTF